MARDRTHDEILDQVVYAAQCVIRHYGPGLDPEGLLFLRNKLNEELRPLWCDAEWTVDVLEGDGEPNPDFCPKILPAEYHGWTFDEVVFSSRTGMYKE